MPDLDLAAVRKALRDLPDLKPEHLFAGMPYVFRPERAPGLFATYRFDLDGAHGGVWTVRFADGACSATREAVEEFDVRIACSDRTFLDLSTGRSRPGEAFVDRRLRVEGDLALAMRFSRLFGGGGS